MPYPNSNFMPYPILHQMNPVNILPSLLWKHWIMLQLNLSNPENGYKILKMYIHPIAMFGRNLASTQTPKQTMYDLKLSLRWCTKMSSQAMSHDNVELVSDISKTVSVSIIRVLYSHIIFIEKGLIPPSPDCVGNSGWNQTVSDILSQLGQCENCLSVTWIKDARSWSLLMMFFEFSHISYYVHGQIT
jgi:Ni,Fe-hydrogenase I large subunit